MSKTTVKRAAVVPATAAPSAVQHTTIDIAPAEGATQALSLRAEASALVIIDKDSHRVGKEFIRGAKQLKRKIEDHWSAITRNVDELKRNLLDLKRKDVEPVDAAIGIAERVIIAYEQVEAERVRVEEARIRREAEEKAARDRAQQLAEQEAAALKLEADSPALSNREQIFVESYVGQGQPAFAVTRAGYKGDAEQVAARLLRTPKIIEAISAKRQAVALREQQAATKAAPLEVKITEKVESQTAKVAGVSSRSTWSAEVFDFNQLLAALGVDVTDPRVQALQPNTVYLNTQAVALHEKLESVYPGVRGAEKKGIAG